MEIRFASYRPYGQARISVDFPVSLRNTSRNVLRSCRRVSPGTPSAPFRAAEWRSYVWHPISTRPDVSRYLYSSQDIMGRLSPARRNVPARDPRTLIVE